MKGWHGQSLRHSLAARGITTTEFKSDSKFRPGNGTIHIYDDDIPIGNVSIEIDEGGIDRYYNHWIPPRTAVLNMIKIYSGHRGRGFGRYLLKSAENYARDYGMDRIWAIHVVDEKFFKMNGYREVHVDEWFEGVRPSIYEKVLR
jgi:GNAT superfamily N-acetyltransferase